LAIWNEVIFINKTTMGLTQRKKSGNKFNGTRLNVTGQGISTVKPGGDNRINKQRGSDNTGAVNRPTNS
jgi:hypothetical protein